MLQELYSFFRSHHNVLFQLEIPPNMVGMEKLVPETLMIPYDLNLSQFGIGGHRWDSSLNDALGAELTFYRGVAYHLSNTYMPTISLLVLVILTLYIDESKLDISVSLSLTVLLVIYTFYQSIAASIPKTAYLKLVDIWLMFILLMPFTIFVIEIIMFLDMMSSNQAPILGTMLYQPKEFLYS